MNEGNTAPIAAGLYVTMIGYGGGTLAGIGGDILGLGCILLGLGIAFALSYRPSIWVALGRRHLLAVPWFVPLAILAGLVLAIEYGLLAYHPEMTLAFIWMTGLLLVGFGLWIAGHTAYGACAAGDVRASWTANPDQSRYRMQIALAALGALVSVVAVLSLLPSSILGGSLAFAISAWITAGRTGEYEACENGLRYSEQGAAGTRFVPWTRITAVRETDHAVVLERRWRPDERMAADDVPATAREAIRTALARSESHDWDHELHGPA